MTGSSSLVLCFRASTCTLALVAGCGGSPGSGLNRSLVDQDEIHAYEPNGLVLANISGLNVERGQDLAFDTYLVSDAGDGVRVSG